MKQHNKDKVSKRHLTELLNSRRGQLKYLKRKNVASYFNIITDLQLKDVV